MTAANGAGAGASPYRCPQPHQRRICGVGDEPADPGRAEARGEVSMAAVIGTVVPAALYADLQRLCRDWFYAEEPLVAR